MSGRRVVCRLTDLADRRGRAFDVDGERVAVLRDGDRAHALGDSCTHLGASLAEGIVADGTVVCPWHGARFDLETGKSLGPPARGGIRRWECRVEGNEVVVE